MKYKYLTETIAYSLSKNKLTIKLQETLDKRASE